MFKICLFLLLSKFKLFYPFQTTTWPRYAPPCKAAATPPWWPAPPPPAPGWGVAPVGATHPGFLPASGWVLTFARSKYTDSVNLTVTKCYERPDCKKLWRKFIRKNFKNNKTQTLIKDPSLKPYCSQGEKDVGELTHRMRRIHLEGNKNRRGEHRVSINQSIIFRERRWNNTSQISKLVNGMSPYIS